MNSKNSTNVVWIDTTMHRCTAMEEDVSYHPDDLRQGRDARNKVPAFSMLAGEPEAPTDAEARAMFWTAYLLAVALTTACAVALAFWPN